MWNRFMFTREALIHLMLINEMNKILGVLFSWQSQHLVKKIHD
jgi:hypothetical protein